MVRQVFPKEAWVNLHLEIWKLSFIVKRCYSDLQREGLQALRTSGFHADIQRKLMREAGFRNLWKMLG